MKMKLSKFSVWNCVFSKLIVVKLVVLVLLYVKVLLKRILLERFVHKVLVKLLFPNSF